MENYIIYEEVGKGDACTVYKGRKKETICFVAVLSVSKARRAAVTNWVRIAHQINDDYVVQFHEWYETTNHLWLVLELCTGGSLQEVLIEDGRLPLNEVRKMGGDICRGIHTLHKNDICVGDLSPSRLLLDGPGVVKINNLSCAHFESEEIEAIYQSVVDEVTNGIEADSLDDENFSMPIRNIVHHSPQALVGHVTLQADIWSLGSILYRMFAGEELYSGAEIDDVLMNIKKESPKSQIEKLKSMDENAKPEDLEKFKNLLILLLQCDIDKRPTIETVLQHPFWGGKFSPKAKEISPIPVAPSTPLRSNEPEKNCPKEESDAQKTLTQSMMDKSVNILPETSLKRQKTELLKSVNSRHTLVSSSIVDMGQSALKESSSIPTQSLTRISAATVNLDDTEVSIMENIPVKKRTLSANTPLNKSVFASDDKPSFSQMMIHSSENPDPENFLSRQRKLTSASIDNKHLPESLTKLNIEGFVEDGEWKSLFGQLNQLLHDSTSKVLISTLTWISHELPKSTEFARRFWLETSHGFIATCCRHIRQSNDHRGRFGRLFATAAYTCEKRLDFENPVVEKNFKDALLSLADALREQFSRNGKQKLQILPALGQMLLIAAKIEVFPGSSSVVSVLCPPPCYSLVIRCVSLGEETQVQSVAAQIIESHVFLSPRSRFCHSGTEAALQLWSMATRATSDGTKHVGFSALAQVCYRTPQQAYTIMEKIGLPQFFESLNAAPQKCQSLMMTVIGVVFLPNPRASSRAMTHRVCQHRDIHSKLIRLADSPSWLVRAKSFLCMSLMLQNQPEYLLLMCKMKLVAVVERESKRLGGRENRTYSHLCLTSLIDQANSLVPSIVLTCSEALDDAATRKHPSTGQLKSLREKLPGLSVLPHLISSSVFRPSLVKEDFLDNICKLATLCENENRLETSLGEDIWKALLDSIISVFEVTCARPELLESNRPVIQAAIPMLIMMILNEDGSRMLYLKLLSELMGIRADLIDHGEDLLVDITFDRLEKLVDVFPQFLLSDHPLPLLALRCLNQIAIIWPSEYVLILPRSGVLEVLVTLTEIQMTEKADQAVQKNLFAVMAQTWSFHSEAIVKTLLENDILKHLIRFVTTLEDFDYDLLLEVYRTCRSMVQAVSEFVKVALKAKSQNAPAQVLRSTGKVADFLLQRCASLEGIIPFVLANFEFPPVNSSTETVKEEKSSELVSLACSTVSLTVHMWGAEGCQALYSVENLDRLSMLLGVGNIRNQRLILKSIRKSIQNQNAITKLAGHSQTIAEIKSLSSSSLQDVQLLATEILHTLLL